jgi:hypothetical protein
MAKTTNNLTGFTMGLEYMEEVDIGSLSAHDTARIVVGALRELKPSLGCRQFVRRIYIVPDSGPTLEISVFADEAGKLVPRDRFECGRRI